MKKHEIIGWIIIFFCGIFIGYIIYNIYYTQFSEQHDNQIFDNIDVNITKAIAEDNATHDEVVKLIKTSCASADFKIISVSSCINLEYSKFIKTKV